MPHIQNGHHFAQWHKGSPQWPPPPPEKGPSQGPPTITLGKAASSDRTDGEIIAIHNHYQDFFFLLRATARCRPNNGQLAAESWAIVGPGPVIASTGRGSRSVVALCRGWEQRPKEVARRPNKIGRSKYLSSLAIYSCRNFKRESRWQF